jgi:mRNA interferase RelE/StbE
MNILLKTIDESMMSYNVFIKKSAEKELDSIPERIQNRIIDRLLILKENPRPKNAKKLRGKDGFRIRIGDYRILYVISEKENRIDVYSIAHRKDVYR